MRSPAGSPGPTPRGGPAALDLGLPTPAGVKGRSAGRKPPLTETRGSRNGSRCTGPISVAFEGIPPVPVHSGRPRGPTGSEDTLGSSHRSAARTGALPHRVRHGGRGGRVVLARGQRTAFACGAAGAPHRPPRIAAGLAARPERLAGRRDPARGADRPNAPRSRRPWQAGSGAARRGYDPPCRNGRSGRRTGP